MSTFGGLMQEFPDIRVDYFRPIPLLRPPLACFLSHVHSDHLTGLETLKSPFVYCSAATKAILLRLERYPHRMNFERGILEARKQHYKSLRNLLKPIPLETPTRIELAPGNEIQVTLFDANHCMGAVMFLIEGQGRAVLYTGDIRSEPWFVNNIARNPCLIEYTSGLKTLNCIYLDTSNIAPIHFPTKAQGLQELLTKVSEYPPDTVFHLSAWTFGYEEVWIALSKALNSQVHVDDYKFKIYKALCSEPVVDSSNWTREGPALAGYQCGNAPQPGCLTRNPTARIHSCEKGTKCPAIDGNVVWIQPIIARTQEGIEIGEVGVGGGGVDLTQSPELEVDSDGMLQDFLNLLTTDDPNVPLELKQKLELAFKSQAKAISLADMGLGHDVHALSLEDLAKAFVTSITQRHKEKPGAEKMVGKLKGTSLPNRIKFPYSRHSSYEELCHLVNIFTPQDVYPCTVDEDNWHPGISVRALFGQYCSGHNFRHDMEMEHVHSHLMQSASSPQKLQHLSMQLSASQSAASSIGSLTVVAERSIEKPSIGRIETHDLISSGSSCDNSSHALKAENSGIPEGKPTSNANGRNSNLEVRAVVSDDGHIFIPSEGTISVSSPENSNEVITGTESEHRNSRMLLVKLEKVPGTEHTYIKSLLAAGFETLQSVAFAPLGILQSITGASETDMRNLVAQATQQIDIQDRDFKSFSTPSKRAPSREIIGVSPGSASQRIRRKALSDGLEQSRTKRLRLDDRFNSTFSKTSDNVSEPQNEGKQQPASVDQRIASFSSRQKSPLADLSDTETSSSDGTSSSEETSSSDDSAECMTYHDLEDGVLRCTGCNHEAWALMGPCTNCSAGQTHFMEVIEPLQPVTMRLVQDEYESEAEISSSIQEELAEQHLDYQSSAYDSQDSASITEEYEIDSFIDDFSIHEHDVEDESSEDDESSYKSQFETVSDELRILQARYIALSSAHTNLIANLEESERDFLGIGSGSEEGPGSEDISQDGLNIVNVNPPDPILTEIVLPAAAQEDSQQSEELTEERVMARAEADESTEDEDAGQSASTGADHTYEEIIL